MLAQDEVAIHVLVERLPAVRDGNGVIQRKVAIRVLVERLPAG